MSYEIENTVEVIRKMQVRINQLQRKVEELNTANKKQRVVIRRFKKLLREAYDMLPKNVSDDLVERIDAAVYSDEGEDV